jgi:hypothetical protein
VSSRNWVPHLSNELFNVDNNCNVTENKKICSLTGKKVKVVESVFPSEKLSVVGKTILLAKNSGTSGPTVRRYGRSGAQSYLVDEAITQKLASSIAFLTSQGLKGKTWSTLPAVVGSAPSLLLAYCKSNLSLTVTTLLTGESDIEDFDDYLDATQTVLKLYGESDCTPDDVIEIAEIIAMDKANRKINYSTSLTMARLKSAAIKWCEACRNRPNLTLMAQVNKQNLRLAPWPIAPKSIINLSKLKYIRNGEDVLNVPAISFADSMKLFLSNSITVKKEAIRYLTRLSHQFEPLLANSALSKVQAVLDKKSQRNKVNYKNNTVALNAVTLMAVLLYKTGRIKEVYMNDFSFQFGQLCSAMDELHVGYCQAVRGGDIPNTLIGNTTYGIALQSPIKAFALLASRLKPYEAWARKEVAKGKPAKGKETHKAVTAGVFAYKWLSSHSARIHKHFVESSEIMNDTYKAELMLGYLAGRPFEGNKKEPNANNTQGEK